MDSIKINSWPRWLGSVVLAATVGLTGCSDGKDGAAGVQGPAGANPIVRSETPTSVVATIDGATVASDGALTVNFTIEDDRGNGFVGLGDSDIRFSIVKLVVPAEDGSATYWQSYVNSNATQAGQESTPSSRNPTAVFGTLVDHRDGSYSYTYVSNLKSVTTPIAVSYEPELTHRVGFQLSGGLPTTNAVYDWRPSDNATTNITTRNIVAKDACNSCHGELALHGGSRVETEMCVTCHNPGTLDSEGVTVDFKIMVHKIHSGKNLNLADTVKYPDGKYEVGGHDYSDVVFPQDIRNCTVCHDESNTNTLEAKNWRTQPTIEACGSCHDAVDFVTGTGHGPTDFPVPTGNEACAGCHDPDGVQPTESNHTGKLALKNQARSLLVATPTGITVTDATAGDVIVTLNLTLEGTGVDAIVSASDPSADISVGLKLDKASKYYTRNGSVAVNWQDGAGSDYQDAHKEIDLSGGTCIPDGSGLFTCTALGLLPGITADAIFTITTVDLFLCYDSDTGGSVNCGTGIKSVEVNPVTAFFDRAGDPLTDGYDSFGADMASCQSCHADNQFHHGATEMVQCKTCHNATRSSGSRTIADLKRHVHRKHSGLDRSGLDVGDIPQDLFPNKVENCNACHSPASRNTRAQYDLPLQQNTRASKALRGRNDPPIEVFVSPSAVVCGSCHISTLLGYIDTGASGYLSLDADTSSATGVQQPDKIPAAEQAVINHMFVNGAVFGAATFDEANIIESCSVCHEIGKEFGVDAVHTLK